MLTPLCCRLLTRGESRGEEQQELTVVVDTAVLQTPSSLGRVLQASALGESRGEEQQKRTALVDTAVLQLPHSRRWVDATTQWAS